MNEKSGILIQFSLNFVSQSPIDNKAALVQIMAWRRKGDCELVLLQSTSYEVENSTPVMGLEPKTARLQEMGYSQEHRVYIYVVVREQELYQSVKCRFRTIRHQNLMITVPADAQEHKKSLAKDKLNTIIFKLS